MDEYSIVSWNENGLFTHLEDFLKILTSDYNPVVLALHTYEQCTSNIIKNIRRHLIIQFQQLLYLFKMRKVGVILPIRFELYFQGISKSIDLQILPATIFFKNHIINE